jgi:hypothetical protein
MILGTICGADRTTQPHLQAEKRGEINLHWDKVVEFETASERCYCCISTTNRTVY